MTAICIDNFGGELPRVSPKALPDAGAQTNENLLATSSEFRPLLDDASVTTGVTDAKSLYRLSRNADGTLCTDPSAGWIAETAYKSYVKGQVNDDATERTYVSFNDGSARPRVIDATGTDRLLGVPPPVSVATSMVKVDKFTFSEASNWLWTLLPTAIADAVNACMQLAEPFTRVKPGATEAVAGPMSFHGLSWMNAGDSDFWNLRYNISYSTAEAAGLIDPSIQADTSVSGSVILRITCLPFWGYVADPTSLLTSLTRMVNPSPADGAPTQLFKTADATEIRDYLVSVFDPDGATLRTQRALLDDIVRRFVAAVDFALSPTSTSGTTSTVTGVPGDAPLPPTKPTTPEFTTTFTAVGTDGDGYYTTFRNSDWVTYDAALATYNQVTLPEYRSSTAVVTAQKSARLAEIAALQAEALTVTQQIERAFTDRHDGLITWAQEFLAARGYVRDVAHPDGTVIAYPDEIVDTRFYVATHVTDWGEESAPCGVSPADGVLEVDQYSSVTLTLPAIPTGRGISKWRIYRTNAGSSSAAFQFVDEVASSTLTYSDTKAAAELGELLPSQAWLQPPYRTGTDGVSTKGTDPYLRGLVGMPNGIMAGFIDNFVAFCEPYHPYAWPAEYQVSVEYPIVGLGAFGQTLFVGTVSNPYFISGSDSASMSAIKLDSAQACVSARSIVAVNGGVVYASPDGLCLASQAGVQLLTGDLFSREDWQALSPSSIFAVSHEGVYYFWYTGGSGGCYALDSVARKLVRVDFPATAVFYDGLADGLFYNTGTSIKRAFSSSRRTGTWKSKKFIMPKHSPLAWFQIDGNQSVDAPATLKWYGDGALVYTATVTDTKPARLPAGLYLEHEIEVSSTARMTKVLLAGDTAELQSL